MFRQRSSVLERVHVLKLGSLVLYGAPAESVVLEPAVARAQADHDQHNDEPDDDPRDNIRHHVSGVMR